MFTDYYGLSFNPFDKQNIKERDAFRTRDHKEMLSRLEYLKDGQAIVSMALGSAYLQPGRGWARPMPCAVP